MATFRRVLANPFQEQFSFLLHLAPLHRRFESQRQQTARAHVLLPAVSVAPRQDQRTSLIRLEDGRTHEWLVHGLAGRHHVLQRHDRFVRGGRFLFVVQIEIRPFRQPVQELARDPECGDRPTGQHGAPVHVQHHHPPAPWTDVGEAVDGAAVRLNRIGMGKDGKAECSMGRRERLGPEVTPSHPKARGARQKPQNGKPAHDVHAGKVHHTVHTLEIRDVRMLLLERWLRHDG
mmetsp:Transcript_4316/g.12355  ORF Transcript_4316/g.12355 Transcript_4316/m.12355 type:complete len:233 (+) Transcript_4316:477-1175(+)